MFGWSVTLSGDGDTLAVGATNEDSNATGIGGNEADDSAVDAGAVYLFVRDDMDAWSQQAYVKASNASANDLLGIHVALSSEGDVLAVAPATATPSPSAPTTKTATPSASTVTRPNDSAAGAGAVYLY